MSRHVSIAFRSVRCNIEFLFFEGRERKGERGENRFDNAVNERFRIFPVFPVFRETFFEENRIEVRKIEAFLIGH